MLVELVIAPEAELDIADAYVWYEGRRAGLGEEFLSSVDACLEGIRRRPEMYPVVHEGYRRSLIRRFPYAVFYEPSEAAVTIYAVFHTSRNPDKWRQRLPLMKLRWNPRLAERPRARCGCTDGAYESTQV